MAALFYNLEGIGDVLLVRLTTNKEVTATVNYDDFTVIYCQDEVIAYNFFHLERAIKERGIIYQPDVELLNEVNARLTKHHLPLVEQIDQPHFNVGKVIECQHIENTHLHLCHVDVGVEVLQIVCGAPNVEKGKVVVVARIGSLMRDGSLIQEGVVKGYTSSGMLCSKAELGLPSDGKRGLYLLDENEYRIGDDFKVAN